MKSQYKSTIAIIGAGPAGAYCAHELSAAGIDVILFDHKAPWEKPCGGMVSYKVFEEFQLLNEYPYPKLTFNNITTISQRSDIIIKELSLPLYTVSRKELGSYLLEKVSVAGARFIKEKVMHVKRNGTEWSIETESGTWTAEFLICADGVNGVTKKEIYVNSHYMNKTLTCGYFLDGVHESKCVFKFMDRIGYLWAYPRPHDYSAGIGYINSNKKITGSMLFPIIDEFISDLFPESQIKSRWSTFIPLALDPGAYDQPRHGTNWMMIGDAAGFVDPLSGEGIYYALKSAEVASKSIIEKVDYGTLWKRDFGSVLIKKSGMIKRLLETESQAGPAAAGAFYYHLMS